MKNMLCVSFPDAVPTSCTPTLPPLVLGAATGRLIRSPSWTFSTSWRSTSQRQRGHGLIKEEASRLEIHAPKQQINPERSRRAAALQGKFLHLSAGSIAH